MESSPGCWQVYGEVLAREYSDAAYFGVHRLTVDAYAAQHPGRPSAQSVQSVAIHLISLCLTFEHGLPAQAAAAAMQRAARDKSRFRWLEPPAHRGKVTVAAVHLAGTADKHAQMVRAWAEEVWAAWSAHHGTIRGWVAAGPRAGLIQSAPHPLPRVERAWK